MTEATSDADALTLDTTAPSVAIGSGGGLTNQASQTIAGTVADANLAANPTITLFDNGAPIGTTTANGGAWSTAITLSGDGGHNITAQATDLAGNTGASNTDALTLDTTAPAVVITSAGGVTNQPRQIIAGTVSDPSFRANPTITLFDNSSKIGTTTANGGNWSASITLSGDGAHNITAQASDLAGNTGTSNTEALTLDTVAPAVTGTLVADTGISSSDGITANPAVTGSADPNATVTIMEGGNTLGASTANASGVWIFTPAGLVDGAHTLTASETDLAGNTGSAPISFTLKTSALTPFGLALSPPAGGNTTTEMTPTITGYGEPGDVLTVFNDTGGQGTTIVAPDGTWSFTAPRRGPGDYHFFATETDIAGNLSAPSAPLSITIETSNFKQLGDYNGDATSDLLYQRQDGSLLVLNLTANQVAAVLIVGQVGPEWQLEVVRDFSGGGTSDLLYRRGDGALQLDNFVSNVVVSTPIIGQIGAEWNLAGAGDFNGDHAADLLWQRTTDQELMIWDINDSQVSTMAMVGHIGPEWQLVGTGDFNADGTVDALWRRATDQTLMIYTINNNQVTATTVVGQVGPEWQVAGTGDFNGDGSSDILFLRSDGALMADDVVNNQVASSTIFGQVPAGWHLFGIGNTDGDGTSNLVLRSDVGATTIYDIVDNHIASTANAGQVGVEWRPFA